MSRNVPVAQKQEEGGVLETIKVIIQALAIALVIRTLLFQPFNIPSGSMIPTLLIGDYVFVSKYAYGYSNYSMPFGPNCLLRPHPRLAAQARRRRGVQAAARQRDRLHQARDRPAGRPDPDDRGPPLHQWRGRAARADRQGAAPRIATAARSRCRPIRRRCRRRRSGVEHTIIEIEGDHGINDNTELFVVPPDHYFMMGDNRDNSTDSRIPPELGGVGYRALRQSRRPRGNHLLLGRRRTSRRWHSGAGPGRCAGTGCSSRRIERRRWRGARPISPRSRRGSVMASRTRRCCDGR